MAANYTLERFELGVNRRAVMVDTGPIVALFAPSDAWEVYASNFFEEYRSRPLLVPTCVVVEAWGCIVAGKNSRIEFGLKMLQWVLSGGVTVIRVDERLLRPSEELCSRLKIDPVDTILVSVADAITTGCELDEPLPIATMDSDMGRIRQKYPLLKFRVLDVRSDDLDVY
jgi:hypothetical protein